MAAALKAAAATTAALGVASLGIKSWMRSELGEESFDRMILAYRRAIPAFLEYKAVYYLHEALPEKLGRQPDTAAADAKYLELHSKWAPEMLQLALQLRGFHLKTAQLLASNFGDVAPRKWQEVFAPLLDAVPPKPFTEVKALVEAELGAPLHTVYSSFEEAPLASASVAQVHRATLAGTGQRVVVKVQHPEAEAQFRGDVHISKTFARVAMPEHVPALAEVEKQFATEFDFRREADNLALVRDNLARETRFADILVPAPIPSLCTKRVLTMTEIPAARKLTDALKEDMAAHAAATGTTLDALMEAEQAANEAALAQGELRCGPDAATMDRYIAALRWRNALGGLVGLRPAHVPRNHAALVDRLLEVHGVMALEHGAISGDPHPGNLLLSARPGGWLSGGATEALALVDFGQVKRLDPSQRLALARLVVALSRADEGNPAHRAAVARLLRDMGMRTERGDADVGFRYAQLFYDKDDKLVTQGKNVQVYVEELNAADAVKAVGDDYVLISRASMMLRGLGHMLNQHRRAAVAWAPAAERVMRAAGEDPAAVLK